MKQKDSEKFADRIMNMGPMTRDVLVEMIEVYTREQIDRYMAQRKEYDKMIATAPQQRPAATVAFKHEPSTVKRVVAASRRF